MIQIFSIIGFIPSILDYEKNVSRTLNSLDDAFLRVRASLQSGLTKPGGLKKSSYLSRGVTRLSHNPKCSIAV